MCRGGSVPHSKHARTTSHGHQLTAIWSGCGQNPSPASRPPLASANNTSGRELEIGSGQVLVNLPQQRRHMAQNRRNTHEDQSQAEPHPRRGAAVSRRCDRRYGADRWYGPGPTWQRVAGVSARKSIRPVSLVPGRSAGPNRKPAGEPGDLGQQHLPHLLPCGTRPRQRCHRHFRGRSPATCTSSAAAGLHSAAPAGLVLGNVPSRAVPARSRGAEAWLGPADRVRVIAQPRRSPAASVHADHDQ